MKYVAIKRNWEYNDEYYYRGEHDGGEPVKIFSDKAKAEAFCTEQNLEELRGLTPTHHCECFEEILKVSPLEFIDLWNRTFGTEYSTIEDESWDVMYDLEIPEKATDDQLRVIRQTLKDDIDDYVVYEVEEE